MSPPRALRFLLGALALTCGEAGAEARKARSRDGVLVDWRQVATVPDRRRLRDWRLAWVRALTRIGTGSDAATIAADPALFDFDHALAQAQPPAGAYRCRVFKLGANGTAARDLAAYPAVDCTVTSADGVSSLYAVSGAQRAVGTIYADAGQRAVFLGTMVLGDETRPLGYGRDANRDMAGYIEQIDPRRWRLVLPWPRFESVIDVVEIVPVVRP